MNQQAVPISTARDGDAAGGAVLVVGATSDIARRVAERLGSCGHSLVLAARDTTQLVIEAAHLRVRCGVPVQTVGFDAETDDAAALIARAVGLGGGELAGVVVALGLFAREASVKDAPDLADRMDRINHRVPVALTQAALPKVPCAGFICVIGSVAGDRVRPNLASYGRSKQALDHALRQLRAQHPQGPLILTAKPGPTDTAMTFGLDAAGPMAEPGEVAACIVRAIHRRRPIVYCPGKWRWIMAVIRLLPGPVFRALMANR